MMKQFLIILVGIGCLTAGWTFRQPSASMNIVFIVADDLSPTLGCYGDSVAPTPTIDRLARQGVVFENAFCTSPSCSPSRASMLTSRYPHQLAEGTNLWGTLPKRYPNYVDLLERAGYRVGLMGKGWGPGDHTVGGYTRNPAGPSFKSFDEFMADQPSGKSFCFWLGPQDPHRPYDAGLKQTLGSTASRLRPQYLKVPATLPDTPEVRDDLLDYYAEVARFEQTVAHVVETLEKTGQLQNTLIVITGDNGMPFPRAKANLYDAGSRIPLVIYGGSRIGAPTEAGKFTGGKRIRTPVSLIDLAPTLLEVAGLPKADGMEGQSLARYVTGKKTVDQPVFIERERHAQVRAGNLSYPMRAIRTSDFLYIQNLKPDRWPAGDPEEVMAVGSYGDIDNGPAKRYLIEHRDHYTALAEGALAKRPADELYDLRQDSNQQTNVAAAAAYRTTREKLNRQLQTWRQRTADPRLTKEGEVIDTYPYYGNRAAKEPK
ncbi:MAG TPA: sulfatase [Spirosoma sp.]|jgi:arylsulfatase A-like enzyme|nr:sulfatase [Spirosoma sp.]